MPSVEFITTGTCTCCGSCTPAVLKCRTRSGTYTLCGHSEFAGFVSDPWRKYRKATWAGNILQCRYNVGPTCTGGFSSGRKFVYSGTNQYNKDTCSTTCTEVIDEFAENFACSGGGTHTHPTASCAFSATTPANFDTTLYLSPGGVSESFTSATVDTLNSLAGCDAFNATSSGSATITLSDEDTDTDAVARLIASGIGSWSSYKEVTVDCDNPACCLASWDDRTGENTFSGLYQEAGWRVEMSGLTPSTSYDVQVQIWRAPYGTGMYTLFDTITASGTTDGSGFLQVDGDVPNDPGFDSYAEEACVVT